MSVKNLKAEIPGFGSINLAEKLFRPTSQDLGHPPHGAGRIWGPIGKLGLAQFANQHGDCVELMAAI